MQTITDPARELVETCLSLKGGGDAKGADFLADQFRVRQWSAEFYQIVFAVSKRFDDVAAIVETLDMDEDLKKEAVSHLGVARNAFGQSGLNSSWKVSEEKYLNATNLGPIKMLSPYVRAKVSYPKLTSEEVRQVFDEVMQLHAWLLDHQLAQNDFIRQALIEGVEQLLFRLERLNWLGWGYTLDSLRDVISAYMFLEQATPDIRTAPDAGAVLAKTRAVVTDILSKAKVTKEAWELGEWGLKAYGAVALVKQGAQSVVALIAN